VDDNGPGIDPDVMGSLFEPYITTKTKGTGLGLAIVKKIVEEHGGMIRAENRTEGGCRFVLRLPVLGGETTTPCDGESLTEDEVRSGTQ
jgi:C4-dicarboxylate-specific signal transduction histidine kinase